MKRNYLHFLVLVGLVCLSRPAGAVTQAAVAQSSAFAQCAAQNNIPLPKGNSPAALTTSQAGIIFACVKAAKKSSFAVCSQQAGLMVGAKPTAAQKIAIHSCMFKLGFSRHPHPVGSAYALSTTPVPTPSIPVLKVAERGSCIFNGHIIASGGNTTAYQAAQVSTGNSCLSQQRVCQAGYLSGRYAFSSCTVAAAKASSAAVSGKWAYSGSCGAACATVCPSSVAIGGVCTTVGSGCFKSGIIFKTPVKCQ